MRVKHASDYKTGSVVVQTLHTTDYPVRRAGHSRRRFSIKGVARHHTNQAGHGGACFHCAQIVRDSDCIVHWPGWHEAIEASASIPSPKSAHLGQFGLHPPGVLVDGRGKPYVCIFESWAAVLDEDMPCRTEIHH